MAALFIYFFKVNFLLLVFTAAYWLLLRRGGLLQLNRLILVASIVLAFLLPVLPMSDFLGQSIPAPVLELTGRPAAALPALESPPIIETSEAAATNTATTSQPATTPKDLRLFAFWTFLGVAGFLFFLLVRQFVHIFKLILYSTNTRESGLTIVHTEEDIPPFSFFRFLVINPAKYAGEELQRIIVHEKVHIRQHHYLDILVGEILRVLCWYNPAAWALNALLKMNLEYIADREVISAGVDRKNYQYQLLHMGVRGQSLRLTTPLNYSPIKMRISMMNTKKSGVLAQLRYALLLPVFLLAVMVINPSPAQAQDTQVMVGTSSPSATTSVSVNPGTISIEGDLVTNSATTMNAGRDVYFVILPSTSRKTLMDVQKALADLGITVKYNNLNYNDGLLTAISVSIRTDEFNSNLSYDPLENRLVFYDLQVSGRMVGFECGTPRAFKPKQQDLIDGISGLLVKKANGDVVIHGRVQLD